MAINSILNKLMYHSFVPNSLGASIKIFLTFFEVLAKKVQLSYKPLSYTKKRVQSAMKVAPEAMTNTPVQTRCIFEFRSE